MCVSLIVRAFSFGGAVGLFPDASLAVCMSTCHGVSILPPNNRISPAWIAHLFFFFSGDAVSAVLIASGASAMCALSRSLTMKMIR